MKQDDILRAYKCADLYYGQKMSQAEIARYLGISRPRVSRLLSFARKFGIVTITVNPPSLFDQSKLSDELIKAYGLYHVFIGVPEENTETAKKRAIATTFQENLPNILTGKKQIGIGLGITVYETVSNLRGKISARDARIVPLMGGVGQSEPSYQNNNIIDLFADFLNAKRTYFMAPAIHITSEQQDVLTRSPIIEAIAKEWEKLDIAIFGLGRPIAENPVLSSDFPRSFVEKLMKRGVVGDILARFFDSEGNLACREVEDFLQGIPFDLFLRVPERVCLAGGVKKLNGIIAALKGSYITTLITDLYTAQMLVEETKK